MWTRWSGVVTVGDWHPPVVAVGFAVQLIAIAMLLLLVVWMLFYDVGEKMLFPINVMIVSTLLYVFGDHLVDPMGSILS